MENCEGEIVNPAQIKQKGFTHGISYRINIVLGLKPVKVTYMGGF